MPTYKYLDDNGLTYYNSKVQAKLDAKLGTSDTAYATASIPYAKVDSTSTATEYTATVPGITQLRQGVSFWLENGVVTSASGFTININGLGAKPVYSNMAAASRDTTIFNVNYTMLFVYDADRVSGGAFICYRGYDTNTNTIGYQLRTNSSTLPAKQTGYRYRLWLTSADGQNYVPINTDTDTSTTGTKALNTTTPIDPFGAIVYNSTNGTVNANANLPNDTQWTQYTFDIRYQKCPLTLTYPDPVYLKCTPQSTGGALISDIVQTLPTTDDGKIYIYLGNAYSATSMELKVDHPVYYYKDGAIRLWTNDAASISSVAWGDITGTLSNQTDLNTALGTKANSADLATVATSGSYNDLTNKPTIPTVNNATLTIQKNSTNVATFTANAASNVTANIAVPTATSDLTNDGEDGSGAYMDEFAIHTTSIDTTNGTFTSDKTFDEVKAAYESGKNIILYATMPESEYSDIYIIPLGNVYIDETNGEYGFYFYYSVADAMGTGTPIVGGVSNTFVSFDISRHGSSSSDYEYSYGYDRRDAYVSITGSLATRPARNTWVPSAQCVYDAIGDVESILTTLNNGGGAQ